jgi:hypothetical protein
MSLRIQNGTPINVPAPADDVLAHDEFEFIGAPFHRGQSLGIPRVRQILDRWCWAACTRMILGTFDQDVQMCEVAEFLLERNCCNGNANSCNRDCGIRDIRRIFRHFQVDAERVSDPVSFERIQEEISERRRPIEAQISWNPGGHVIVVDGWRQRNQIRFVTVKDPWYELVEVRLSDLRENYTVDAGKWVGTWIGFRQE